MSVSAGYKGQDMLHAPMATYDLRSAMSKELRAALEELNEASKSVRAVHRCRVRIKRARALARVGSACAPGLAGVFNDTARAVMRTLEKARTLPALSETAAELAPKTKAKTAAALNAMSDLLAAEMAAQPPLDLDQARTGLKDLLALALVWPEASPRQIRRGARRVLRRARTASKNARKGDINSRHEWRKREKDRFFAATLMDEQWPAARRRKLGERLGDTLGEERDIALLLDRVHAAPIANESPKSRRRLIRALRERHKKLVARADKIGARLHRSGD